MKKKDSVILRVILRNIFMQVSEVIIVSGIREHLIMENRKSPTFY